MKKLFFALCSLLILLSGCSSKKLPEKKVKLLLDWWANPNHVALYAGVKKGFFEKHGIDLEIISLQDPPDALMYLLSDNVDISLYYLPLCLRVYPKTKNFKIIGKLIDHPLYSLIASEDAGISKIKDFEGKTIGHFGDTLSKAAFDSFEEKYDVHFKEKKILSFDPSTALYTKAVDVISGVYWNIEMFQLEENNVKVKCFRWEDFGFPSYPELVFVAKDSFLQKNQKKLKAFQEGLKESIAFAIENKAEAYELYQSFFSETKLPWEKKAWEATAPLLAKKQIFDQEKLKNINKWLEDKNLFIESFDPADVLYSPEEKLP